MPGSMLILTWVGIIFVKILHRARSENYFDSNGAFTVILCIQVYLDRGYCWVLFQLPPPHPRYYLQEYIYTIKN
jgi:hypothetical protein